MKSILIAILIAASSIFGACANRRGPERGPAPTPISTPISTPEPTFKEPGKDDVVCDPESGISYVKNQLLISAALDAPKGETERLIKELGAEIVGYIELTNDYQIEFTEDKTLAELEAAADYLDSFPFVQGVTLNLVHELNYDAEAPDIHNYLK